MNYLLMIAGSFFEALAFIFSIPMVMMNSVAQLFYAAGGVGEDPTQE